MVVRLTTLPRLSLPLATCLIEVTAGVTRAGLLTTAYTGRSFVVFVVLAMAVSCTESGWEGWP